jgi:hypothetical protein
LDTLHTWQAFCCGVAWAASCVVLLSCNDHEITNGIVSAVVVSMVNLETITRAPAQVKARNHTVDKLVALAIPNKHVLALTMVYTRVYLNQEMDVMLIPRKWDYDASSTGNPVIIIHAVDRNGWFVTKVV